MTAQPPKGDLIAWVGNRQRGHFAVNGERLEVPDDAELAEIRERLVGRTVVRVELFLDDGYALQLDNGQVLDVTGTGIRFWGDPTTKGAW